MIRKQKINLTLALTSIFVGQSAFAETNANAGAVVRSVSGQLANAGNLLVVILMIGGFWCLWKIVTTLMNREDERNYPMKNVPLYFAGAAIGLGASLSSDLAINTIFGGTNTDKLDSETFTIKAE